MTILSPQKSALLSHPVPGSRDVVAALLPWRRRLTLQHTLSWLLRGCAASLIFASLVLLIARLVPWAYALTWAEGLALFCLALFVVLAIRSRPSLTRTARVIDHRLGLHDRLSTAWELREEASPLAGLQRRDALKHLKKFTPATSISLRPTRTILITLIAFALALVLLVMLPNPMDRVLQQQAALRTRIARQVAAVEHIRQQLAQSPTLTKQQQQQLDQLLQELASQLQQAKSGTEAQQDIAQAQTKIDQLRNPQAAQNAQAQNTAGNALQNSSDPALKSVGQALTNNDPQSLAKALQKLTQEASKMTPQQRSNLAQQLEQAANQSNQNAQLSSALRDLAKSLTDNNSAEQAAATKEMQAAATQNAQNQAKEQSLNQASQSLQQVANNLAASSDGSQSQQAQSQQGQSQQGQSQQQGQSATQQGKTGTPGQSQQGQPGQQGQQGSGQSSGAKGSNGTGKSEQVYVPGQVSVGTSQQTSDQGSGVVQSGSNVPYSQVIAQYDQMAHDAIDNSNISADLKDLVHQYFNSLEGQ